MPELPEVHHIATWLAPQLTGACVEAVRSTLGDDVCLPQGANYLTDQMAGKPILAVSRRGKLIFLDFTHGRLAIHLKMTGQLWLQSGKAHIRAELRLTDGRALQLADQRKFGWMRWWTHEEYQRWSNATGPEPLPDLPEEWSERMAGRRSVKSFLLDQRSVAGIGNIYADEIVFRARIRPDRRLETLSTEEKLRLKESVVEEMSAAVNERHGEPDQKRIGGGDRSVKKLFNWAVFQREGESCRVCGERVVRTYVAQRGTYYCPSCQR